MQLICLIIAWPLGMTNWKLGLKKIFLDTCLLWPLLFTFKRKQKYKFHEVGTLSVLLLGLHSVQLLFNYLLNY